VLHGNRTYLLTNKDGQIEEAHSISAGLDYPGIGPEHAWLADIGRIKFLSATDKEALEAFQLCSQLEGIMRHRDNLPTLVFNGVKRMLWRCRLTMPTSISFVASSARCSFPTAPPATGKQGGS
jgi:hypothetical protein